MGRCVKFACSKNDTLPKWLMFIFSYCAQVFVMLGHNGAGVFGVNLLFDAVKI